jgi:hypothetical protein
MELEQLGEQAEPLLRKALVGKPSAEVSQRIEALVGKLAAPIRVPDTLHFLRAIEALEHAGTAEAQEVLKKMAKGASETRLTQEAKASLERLAKRP